MQYCKYILAAVILSITLGCNERPTVEMGNGYRFDYDPVLSNYYAIFGPYEYTYAVPDNVTQFDFDSIFIIAEQKPVHRIMDSLHNVPGMDYYYKQRKFIEKSTFFQYWIVNKAKDSIYGPFQKEEFIRRRKQLGVPDSLKLHL